MKNKTIRILALLVLAGSGILQACGDKQNSSLVSNSQTSVESQSFSGQGAPSATLGKDGDTYKDLLTNETYTKVNGTWVKDQGQSSFTGVGKPDNDMGKDGDTYTDTKTGDEYQKQNGYWVKTKEGDTTEKVTVSFDLNGGQLQDGSISLPSQKIKRGEWASEPTSVPSKKNSTFLGWYSGNSDTKWVFTNAVYGDLLLKAHYSVNEEDKITLFVDPNNGQERYSVDTYVGEYLTLDIPYKASFNFTGWYLNNGTEKFGGIVTEDMNQQTLYAHYEKTKFNVTYDIEDKGEVTITGLRDIETTSIDIPENINGHNVTKIGAKAFQNRTSLVSVNLPKTIKVIEEGAFNYARALQKVTISSDNVHFKSVDGILYDKSMEKLVLIPAKNTTSYTCPSTLKKIGAYAAFYHNDGGLKTIQFNEGLEEIGDSAFAVNNSFTTLDFPSTLKKIGNGAFNCFSQGNIQVVGFNDGLESIGDNAFAGAYFKDTLTLPNSVKSIGAYAFANCTAITKFIFPKGLTFLGNNAFAGATGILSINIADGNTAFAVEDSILYTKDMKTLVMCPSGRTEEVTMPQGVTKIGDYAFYMVDECQKYSLPSSLTEIGHDAFALCYGLRNFTIPDSVTKIGNNCFDRDEKLISVTLGQGLKTIPEYSFADCSSLSSISFPANIEEIGDNAFCGTASLSKIEFAEGLKKIGEGSFFFYGADEDDVSTPKKAVLKSIVLPDSLTSLGSHCFKDQDALTDVAFGSGLVDVGINVFSGCPLTQMTLKATNNSLSISNQVLYDKDKTKAILSAPGLTGALVLPDTLKTIEPYAFYNQTKLTSVSFPDSLVTIKEGAFYNLFSKNDSGTISLGNSLKTIEDGAFSSTGASQITFGNSLETIGEGAFTWAKETSLVLPDTLKSIGETAFSYNSNLTTLSLSSGLVTLGENAFYNCTKLAGIIELGSKFTNYLPGVFANCTSLEGFEVDASNANFKSLSGLLLSHDQKEVYAYAPGFKKDGVKATSLTLPEGVTTIKERGLGAAIYLKTINLPASLTTIEEEGFSNTNGVFSLNIPSSVTFVGKNAFKYFTDKQTVAFNCTEDYARQYFEQYYDNGGNASFTYKESI